MKRSKTGTVKGGYLPNYQVFYVSGVPCLVKVKPAKEEKQFSRSIKHVKIGNPGECASCANAEAGMEAGIGKLCISNDSTFIAINKWVRNGSRNFGIGTIYSHDQGPFQKRFDTDKEGLLASLDAEGVVTLKPYTRHRKPVASGKSGRSGALKAGPGGKTVMRTRTSEKGALRRAKRAGLGFTFHGTLERK